MTILIWVDPGVSSGVAVGRYTEDEPYELLEAYQTDGGLLGFIEWHERLYGLMEDHPVYDLEPHVWGCEKFTPRPNAKGGGLPLKVVEPLRIEGWLVGESFLPDYPLEPGTPKPAEWQQPSDQYFAGGKDQPEKKKRQHAWLKEHGFYVTGKMLGQPNADDARSAIAHSIAYMRKFEHRPTLERYFR